MPQFLPLKVFPEQFLPGSPWQQGSREAARPSSAGEAKTSRAWG